MQRQTVSTGTPWEKVVAYSRAVRIGPHVYVSGTTGSNSDGTNVAVGDAYQQTVFILRKIDTALKEVGARLRGFGSDSENSDDAQIVWITLLNFAKKVYK